jgi:MFS family permease
VSRARPATPGPSPWWWSSPEFSRPAPAVTPAWRLDLGAVCVYLTLGATFSALPRTVTGELGGSTAVAGFSVSVFFVAAVLARPLAGRLVDRRGRRPLLVAAPLAVAAVMLGLAVAPSVAVVLVLRFAQGIAGGSFYVAAVTAETDLAPPARRASAVARLSVFIYGAFAVGPLVGEFLVDRGRALAFVVLAAVAAVGTLFTLTVPETRPTTPEPPVGASDDPAAPPARRRIVHRSAVLPGVTLLSMGVGYASITALSALVAPVVGLGSSGPLYVTFAVTILVLRLGTGRLAEMFGLVRVMFPGMVSFICGFVALAMAAAAGRAVLAIAGVALAGVGWAMVFPALVAWLSERVPDAERGAALGTAVAFMDIGQGSGGYLVGAVADVAGFGWAYLVPAALATAGTAVLAVVVTPSTRVRRPRSA